MDLSGAIIPAQTGMPSAVGEDRPVYKEKQGGSKMGKDREKKMAPEGQCESLCLTVAQSRKTKAHTELG